MSFGIASRVEHALGHRIVAALQLEEVDRQQVVDESQRDEVEHDRRDDFVGTGLGSQVAGNAAPDGTTDQGGDDGQRDVDEDGQVELEADHEGEHAADEHLTVGADVEETGLESDGNGQTGQDQRSRPGEGLGDGAEATEGTLEERHVGIDQSVQRVGDGLPGIRAPQLEGVEVAEGDDDSARR